MDISRKQQIVEKALHIILNKGISSLTIKNIAKSMGFVESAVYKHYPSKIAILKDIISYVSIECEQVLLRIDLVKKDEKDKLYCYVSEWSSLYTAKPYIIPILFSKELFKFSTDITDKIQQILNIQYNFLNKIIESGQNNNIFIDTIEVNHLRLIITSPWVLLIDNWFYLGRNFPLYEASKQLIDEIMKLVKYRPCS